MAQQLLSKTQYKYIIRYSHLTLRISTFPIKAGKESAPWPVFRTITNREVQNLKDIFILQQRLNAL